MAGQPGMGINGGLTQRMGPQPEVGAPVNGCNIVVGVDDVDGLMRRGLELGGTEALPRDGHAGRRPRSATCSTPTTTCSGCISPVLSDGTTGRWARRRAV